VDAFDLLNRRRSVPSRQLGAPGPDPQQLDALLRAAVRVPDHGMLVPFRLVLVRGDARRRLAEAIADIHQRKVPDIAPSLLQKDRDRFTHAPLIVAVVARIIDHPKGPPQEQLLTAGCVAFNLLLGAQALGFGAQWLTGWSAHDRDVAELLGLSGTESVIGWIHIGTPEAEAPERIRPSLGDVVSEWS